MARPRWCRQSPNMVSDMKISLLYATSRPRTLETSRTAASHSSIWGVFNALAAAPLSCFPPWLRCSVLRPFSLPRISSRSLDTGGYLHTVRLIDKTTWTLGKRCRAEPGLLVPRPFISGCNNRTPFADWPLSKRGMASRCGLAETILYTAWRSSLLVPSLSCALDTYLGRDFSPHPPFPGLRG
jgi:hypothetical protein